MKVLWLTNILLPEAYKILTGKERHGSGGWLESSANGVVETENVSLNIATASSMVKELVILQGKKITYYVFPFSKKYKAESYEPYMMALRNTISPDIVHVHGTEFPYGLAYMNVSGSDNVVVSMQGVIGIIAEKYFDGLSKWQIFKNITLRDICIKTIFGEEKEYRARGLREVETIKKAKYVIGRTDFDRQYILSINPKCKYMHCNESLREEFYHHKWCYEACIPHTIFLSQSNYPVKGLHQFLKVLPNLKRKYPDIQVRIAGEDITKHKTISEYMKYSGYGSIIYHLIKNFHLEDCVHFTGLLNEQEMVREYLNANVFVCPSTCENSSNSIAEAQILGVPCVASDRGGNADMIPDMRYGVLYDFYDLVSLNKALEKLFEHTVSYDNTVCIKMAQKRHNKKENLKRTLEIYQTIYNRLYESTY